MTLRRAIDIAIVLVVLLFIAAAFYLWPSFAFGNRWNKPTDFVDQFVALTRQHNRLGDNELASSLSIELLDTYVRDLYVAAAGPENVTYTDYDPDRVRLDRGIFKPDATPTQRELARRIIDGLSTGKIADELDRIREDPRIVVHPAPGSVIFACNLPDATIRFVTSGLESSAAQSQQQGDIASSILALQRMAGLVRAEYSVPMCLSMLVGCANEQRLHARIATLIESEELTDDQLAEMKALCESIKGPDLLYVLEGERLTMLDLTRATFKDSLRTRWDARSQMKRLDEVCTDRIARATRQLADWKNTPDGTPADHWTKRERLIYAPALAIALSDRGPVGVVLGTQTVRDGSRAIVAIERYRREHGRVPESLAALVPKYLDAVPMDRFVSESLRYRVVSDDEYQLYSVGADAEDNAGVPAEQPDDALSIRAPCTDFIIHPRSE